jgi:hypothetical protein
LVVSSLAVLALAAPADAAFPGANGKIAFVHWVGGGTAQIYTMNPDGNDRTPLTTGPAHHFEPTWSPDGTKIAYRSNPNAPNPSSCPDSCNYDIYVMDADGTNQTRLTTRPEFDGSPAWSPDGTKIAFESRPAGEEIGSDIYVMNADGTGVTRVTTNGDEDVDPSWSPDGSRIAYSSAYEDPANGFVQQIVLINPDGTNRTLPADSEDFRELEPDWSPFGTRIALQLPLCPGFACEDRSQDAITMNPDGTGVASLDHHGTTPAWSPDGSRIAVGRETCAESGGLVFCGWRDVLTMNPDGSGKVNLTNNPNGQASGQPSWQPIPQSYVRPRGATPLLASLVPAYKPCAAPNSTHGAPLAFASCNPPQPASSHLTVGTPDSNGGGAKAIGSLRLKTVLCPACASPMPRADVRLDVSITDVRNTDVALSDYTGQLQADASLRITDRLNTPNPGGPGPGTVTDTHFPFAVPCAATSDTSIGSTCSVSTTANAVVGGSVVADQRTIWQLGQIQVYDGGASGVAGASDARPFMTQGILIP